MLRDLKTILKALGRGIQTCVEEKYGCLIFKSNILPLLMCLFDIIISVSLFPRWQSLHHFDTFIHITFTDGNKMRDLARVGCIISIYCPQLHSNLFISGGILCLPECDDPHKNSGRLSAASYDQELFRFGESL